MNNKPSHSFHGVSKQQGGIYLFLAGLLVILMSGALFVHEMGTKMVMQANLENYAKEIARVALKNELTITKEALESGNFTATADRVEAILNGLGYEGSLDVDYVFGNRNADGEFFPLAFVAPIPQNPRGQAALNLNEPPLFSAIEVTLELNRNFALNRFENFRPRATVVFGLEGTLDSCELRYQMCVRDSQAPTAIAGLPNSLARSNYCQYGHVPRDGSRPKYVNIRTGSGNISESIWDNLNSPAQPWYRQSSQDIQERKINRNCPFLGIGLLGIRIEIPTYISRTDPMYIGQQATCIPGTDEGNIAANRCMFYDLNNYSNALLGVCLSEISLSLITPDSTYRAHSCNNYRAVSAGGDVINDNEQGLEDADTRFVLLQLFLGGLSRAADAYQFIEGAFRFSR